MVDLWGISMLGAEEQWERRYVIGVDLQLFELAKLEEYNMNHKKLKLKGELICRKSFAALHKKYKTKIREYEE